MHIYLNKDAPHGDKLNRLLAYIIGMGNELINYYQLVQEADAISLTEKEAFIYFKSSLGLDQNADDVMSRGTYYNYLKRVKDDKKEMVFTVAKDLPGIHITQITSLQIVRKKLMITFLSTTSPKLLCDLSRAIVEVERAIAEWNGWTQKITEETLRKFEHTAEKTEEPIIHPPGSN